MQKGNKNSRRSFIKNTAVLAAAPSLIGTGAKKEQVIHHVFFWLKNPSDQTRAELIKGLKTLASIPQVKKLLVGTPAATEKRDVIEDSYHVSELIFFNSVKDQNDYQIHPLHKTFVEKCSHLWERVVVYDMATV